jgi:diguanylate cyclase (GGDEF)-like protein
MLDRIALRATFWGALAILAMGGAFAALGSLALPSFVNAAPFLSAIALLIAVAGWRLLHRELLRRSAHDVGVRAQMQRLHEAMHASMDGLFLLRGVRDQLGELVDLEISDVNGRGAALLYQQRDALVGRRLRRDLGTLGERMFEQYAMAIVMGAPVVEEARVNRRQIAAGWLMHQAIPTSDGIAVTLRDISRRKREEARLRKASLTDDLTRLYNRRGFLALADQQLRVARRQGKDAVVMYVDMDGFKQLNDSYGHAMGDRALVAVARMLQETVRDCDVVARLGGDEFTVLALDADGIGARVIQRRIEERLALLNARGDFPVALGLTIGHTRVRPTEHAGVSELLARADQLLYARKRRRQLTKATSESARPATRGPRRTPRVSPTVVPAEVAAVARRAARNLPTAMNTTTATPAQPLSA